MRKSIIILFSVFLISSLYSQNSSYIYRERGGIEGYIFDKEHYVFLSVEMQKNRFTPSNEDISLAETILKDSISYIKNNQSFQRGNPIIYKNIDNYIRQYVGFTTKSNEKIIWINFLWKGYLESNLEKNDIVYMFDGGSFFWSIFINISKRELFDMAVNGGS